MCPICGTALNLSASPQADRERVFIRRQIAAGKTKDEIKAELVAQYGTQVLAEPPKSGFDLTAWVVPGAAILIAAVAIALGLWRWRRAARGGGGSPPAGGGPAPRPRRRRAARRRPGAVRPLSSRAMRSTAFGVGHSGGLTPALLSDCAHPIIAWDTSQHTMYGREWSQGFRLTGRESHGFSSPPRFGE